MQKLILIVALFACASYAAICHSWGDPHNRLLSGQDYSMYNVQGDFTFFKYEDINVQERVIYSQTWRRNSLLIGAAVKFNGNVFELLNNQVKLNGQSANTAALNRAGVSVSGNVFTINYKRIVIKVHNHANNDAIAGRNYLSLYVEVPEDIRKSRRAQLRGLCVENDIARYAIRSNGRSLFSSRARYTEFPPQPRRKFTRKEKREARRACRATGLESVKSIDNCVYDYLRAGNKQAVIRAYTSDHLDNVRLRQKEKNDAAAQKIALQKCHRSLNDLQNQLNRVNIQLAQARQSDANNQRRINNLNAELDRLRRALSNASNKLNAAEHKVRVYINENRNLNNRVNSANNEIRRLQQQLNDLRNRYVRLEAECERRLKQARADYNRQVSKLSNDYNNRLRYELNRQSQQLTQQFNNALRQQQNQFNSALRQMQNNHQKILSQVQQCVNNARNQRL